VPFTIEHPPDTAAASLCATGKPRLVDVADAGESLMDGMTNDAGGQASRPAARITFWYDRRCNSIA